jgi:hypothetical protein
MLHEITANAAGIACRNQAITNLRRIFQQRQTRF